MRRSTTMLVHKAWLETRGRFWAALAVLVGISLYGILQAPNIIHAREQLRPEEHVSYARYIWILLYSGYLQALWILSGVILSCGGLWREKFSGSAGFTLALPVSRRCHVLIRTAVGVVELIILAFIPSLLIGELSPLCGYAYPLQQASNFSCLMIGGGLTFYSWGLLLSHLMQGEFTTPTLGIGFCLVLFILFKLPHLHAYSPFDLMSGKAYLDPSTFLLRGGLPWFPLSICLAIAAVTLFITVKIAESREF